jgi:Hint domain
MAEFLTINIDDSVLSESKGALQIDVDAYSTDVSTAQDITFTDGGDFLSGGATGIKITKVGKDDDQPDVYRFDLSTFDDDFDISIKSEGDEDTFVFQDVESYAVQGGVYTIDYTGSDGITHTITLDPGTATVTMLCLTRGTQISTPCGTRRVETIKAGDLVNTWDHGPREVVWTSYRSPVFAGKDDRRRPIHLPAGCLGSGKPERDLVVSPHHRILMGGAVVRQMHSVNEVIVPAKGLTGLNGIRPLRGVRTVDYINLLFKNHELLLAEGCLVESLLFGAQMQETLSADMVELFDQARSEGVLSAMPVAPVRKILTVGETRELIELGKTADLCLGQLETLPDSNFRAVSENASAAVLQ